MYSIFPLLFRGEEVEVGVEREVEEQVVDEDEDDDGDDEEEKEDEEQEEPLQIRPSCLMGGL